MNQLAEESQCTQVGKCFVFSNAVFKILTSSLRYYDKTKGKKKTQQLIWASLSVPSSLMKTTKSLPFQ